MPDWGVDSYHVNVGNGDCAIHLLVNLPPKDATPIVFRAVLMDGGSTRAKLNPNTRINDPNPIRQAVQWLTPRYQWQNSTVNQCKFNSIVVTHWDEDHYGGVLSTIKGDAIRTPAAIPYLIYNDAGEPLTFLYCPNWEGGARLNPAPFNYIGIGTTNGLAYINTLWNGNSTAAVNWVSFAQLRTISAATPQLSNVLGADIFTNRLCTTVDQAVSLPDLVARNPPQQLVPGTTHPAQMYCIAVQQQVPGPQPTGVIPEDPTLTNRYSIVCIIYFPQSGRISHYLGGDADEQTENKIRWWLGQGVPAFPKFTSMKLSHHGSRSSTPVSLVLSALPYNIVVSNPSSRHRHPSVEIILFLVVYSIIGREALPAPPRVLATKFPHFFGLQTLDNGATFSYKKPNAVNPVTFEHAAVNPYAQYWVSIQDLVNIISEQLLPSGQFYNSPLQDYNNYLPGKTNAQMRQWLLATLNQLWSLSCHPPEPYYPHPQAYVYPHGRPTHHYIDYIQILCRDDESDGIVRHKFFGMPNPVMYERYQNKTSIPVQNTATPANVPAGGIQLFPVTVIDIPVPHAVSDSVSGTMAAPDSSDVLYFHVARGVIINGRFDDEDGTDPNEDTDDAPVSGTGIPADFFKLVSPPAKSGAPVRAKDDGYYFFASRVKNVPIEPTQFSILTSETSLDTFVGALHRGNICLVGPTPPPATGSTLLLESDEFGNYLTNAIQATELSIINAGGTSIGGFAFAIPLTVGRASGALVARGQATLDPNTPVFLYSTNAVADAFGVSTPPSQGIIPGANILVLGLDTTAWDKPLTISLGDLVKFTNLNTLAKSPVIIFLNAIQLTLDKANTKGRRNAAWFEPLNHYKVTLRLEFDLSTDAVATINKYISVLAGISVQSASLIAKRTSTWFPGAAVKGVAPAALALHDGSLIFEAKVLVSDILFDAAIEVFEDQMQLEMVFDSKTDIMSKIFGVLKRILNLPGDNFDFADWLKKTAGPISFDLPYLRRMLIVLQDNTCEGTNGPSSKVTRVAIDWEARVNLSSGVFAIFLMTYEWQKEGQGSSLTCKLWNSSGLDTQQLQLMLPDYEAYNHLQPVTLNEGEKWPMYLDISKIGALSGMPREIPHEVSQAELMVGSGGFEFSGTVVCGDPSTARNDLPKFYLGQIYLNASYTWDAKTPDIGFGLAVMIEPPNDAQNGIPAQITGAVAYTSGKWQTTAGVDGLYGSTLVQFFDDGSKAAVSSILDSIEIKTMSVEYDYDASGAGSSFTIGGVLLLGALELDLDFENIKDSWQFVANLKTKETQADSTKVGEIASSILGSSVGGILPDFVADIPVKPPKTQDAVGLKISRAVVPDAVANGLFFVAWVDIEGLTFQAVQYQGPTVKGMESKPPVQRLFVVSITQLKEVDVPIIGNVAQPFDEMLFVYVQQQDEPDAPRGITHEAITAVNAELSNQKRKEVPYKVTKTDKAYQRTDVVLAAGFHFILVLKDDTGKAKVALDYVFGQPPAPKPSTAKAGKGSANDDSGQIVAVTTDAESQDPGSSKAPYQKKFGPITVENLGLKVSLGSPVTLSILVDASILLGPIGVGLIGFSLSLTFKEGTSLFTLPKTSFDLQGLAIAFDQAPINIAGMFAHGTKIVPGPPTATVDYYQGAAILTFKPYIFEAAGYYGSVTAKTGSFECGFVYFILQGPIATFEFAEINGVTGGFGYNTNLQFPSVTNVLDFPFIKSPSSDGPEKEIASLMDSGWFFPQPDSFWVAAGLTVLAFQMLKVQAVVVVQWDPKVKLGLFGVATADMPAGVSDDVKFAHVQLGVVATLDFDAGTLKIEGQLTPNSYVLNPSCHLTGGFALYTWFGGSDPALQGDWVFTIGGYHRSYKPPSQYPNPPRLGISWSYDSSLTIRGEAYFAITPKVCMGGGRLDASLSLGLLYAFFDAYADFLINYKPFHFTAEGGLSIGVQFTLDLWICTIHINVEIGATLYLEGPPMAGTVHVNFWVFGFDIDFGNRSSGSIDALLLADFYNLVLQSDLPRPSTSQSTTVTLSKQGDNEHGAQAKASEDPIPGHVFSCNNGLIPGGKDGTQPEDAIWNVRGAIFQFTVACRFAIDSADVVTKPISGDSYTSPVHGIQGPIYAKPMQLTDPLSSSLTITISTVEPPKTPALMAKEGDDSKPLVWGANVPIIKSVPRALWDIYDPCKDPTSASNPNRIPTLLDGSAPAMPLTMGITLSSPVPKLSSDLIPPFEYATFFIKDVDPDPPYEFPKVPDSNPAWYPQPESDGPGEWEAVRTTWLGTPGLGEGANTTAVDLWARLSFTKWDITSVGHITGKTPAKLLDKEVFQTFFLEAPRVSVAMA